MKNINIFSRIFLFISSSAGIVWIGSYVARLSLAYQLFYGNYFSLKSYVTAQNLPGILTTLNPGIILSGIAYLVFIISFIIFLASSGISLKKNGWLFISMLLIFITMPFELFLMVKFDYKIINAVSSGTFNGTEVLNYYIARFKVLGSFPLIELISYGAVIFFIIFRPFNIKSKPES